jgi:DNA-binding NtrC family response regulator
VAAGKFREDLYYRLNVIHIQMPPLRERMDDVPLLVEHFLSKYRWRPEAIPTTISEDAMARLMAHDWPGNVRELENAIERAVVLSRGAPIMVEHFPLTDASALTASRAQRRRRGERADNAAARADGDGDGVGVGGNGAVTTFKEAVESLEKRLIGEALERHGGNRSKAAEELGIYRRLLYAKIREYGLGE